MSYEELIQSIAQNNITNVKKLVTLGVDINTLDSENKSILYFPIKLGYSELLEYLLSLTLVVINSQDLTGNTALHYAIIAKNINYVRLLLEHNANPQIYNKLGFNSFHLSIQLKCHDICVLLSDYVDINITTKHTGESGLHLAINTTQYDTIRFLLKKGINLNIQEAEDQLSVLHYSIVLNDIKIVNMLLEYDIDTNLQDITGNSVLVYTIIENNTQCYDILIKRGVNVNIINVEGKTALHYILEQANYKDFIDKILPTANMNIQDMNGDSPLHYMTRMNVWENYINILKTKKLNGNVRNANNMRPFDYVINKDTFLDLLAQSYLYILKKVDKTWSTDWENMCKNDVTMETKCLNKIKQTIMLNDNLPTYPKTTSSFVLPVIKEIEFCTFTGSSLDVICGLIYLLKKHTDVSTPITRNIICKKKDFKNYEIGWINLVLVIPLNFQIHMDIVIENEKRFVIIPLGITLNLDSHSNYIIIDKRNKTIERFEPNGAYPPPGFDYNPEELDNTLQKLFSKYDYSYYDPKTYLPKVGLQNIDISEEKNKKIGDPCGFCAIWSIWYCDLRLDYPEIDKKKLIKLLVKTFRIENKSFKNTVRNFSQFITEIRDKILQKANLDVNKWINENYTIEQKDIVLTQIQNLISQNLYQ